MSKKAQLNSTFISSDMSKKAVIVGLCYKNAPLPPGSNERTTTEGCINATKHFRNILIYYFRFPPQNIVYISDEDREPRENEILDELCKMVKEAQSKDILLFVYSGHGGSFECRYNNNSGRVEFIVIGYRNGLARGITDHKFREIVETVPSDCSFTMISDSCSSGALIEGAFEMRGHSTLNPVDDRDKAPSTRYIQDRLNPPSGRPLGILISSCQNDQSSKHLKNGDAATTCFLSVLSEVIKENGIHMSNLKLYRKIIGYMARVGRLKAQRPGLYCDDTQKLLKFLSLEESDEMDDDEPAEPEPAEPESMDIDQANILLGKAKRADQSTDASTSTE